MKLGKKYNTLSYQQYCYAINRHKEYVDWNSLGLYRSIKENKKLDLEQKIALRDLANTFFEKTFNFLQLKDPSTYFYLTTLGDELTVADEARIWEIIRHNQEAILKNKKIKHRNFGDYSKHNCGYKNCTLEGLMIRQGSILAECQMFFDSDKDRWGVQQKSKSHRKDRKRNKLYYKDEIQAYLDASKDED